MKKMNFLQKILGNEKIKDRIVTGKKVSYHLNFSNTIFEWYRIRSQVVWHEAIDLGFHTDRYEDLEVVYVMPTGLDGKEITLDMSQKIIQGSNKEKYNSWKESESLPIIRDGGLLGVYSKGRKEEGGNHSTTQDVLIFCTLKNKNDTLIQLSSTIPVSAPNELVEEVKKIFLSIQISG